MFPGINSANKNVMAYQFGPRELTRFERRLGNLAF
jgi:hypothetical protein